ncbi:hypothetical protein LTR86_011024 [Recurvomyces mirabilis]|nr:hypothetical protein LTR86_011024 [Recurvomyces mirabilis]
MFTSQAFAAEKIRTYVHLTKEHMKEIAANYEFMQKKSLCEDEFATYAKEKFFMGERREVGPPEDRQWRAERMLQMRPPDGDPKWLAPPSILPCADGVDDYSWVLRPDCAYWLSMRGFNPDYVDEVGGCCFVYRDWVTCPYLTIEFKRDEWASCAAQNQVCAAGSLALYNRYLLHIKATGDDLPTTVDVTPPASTSWLRHYAITFEGPAFYIWVLRTKLDSGGAWAGCEMSRLSHGSCTEVPQVDRFVQWLSSIHRWGLTDHASSCQRDVKQILSAEKVDVSGPDQPHLTLVDLPGLIHAESKQQSAQDMDPVSSLVRDYIAIPRSIRFAAVSAENDYAVQIVVEHRLKSLLRAPQACRIRRRVMKPIGILLDPQPQPGSRWLMWMAVTVTPLGDRARISLTYRVKLHCSTEGVED